MKVHTILSYSGEGNASICGIYRRKADAVKHFKLCITDTFAGDPDATPAVIQAAIKKALKDGIHDYPGDGCDNPPWFSLDVDVVK